jgi:hypothetical protein
MVEFTKEATRMIKSTGEESTLGQMAEGMTENFTKENSMDKVQWFSRMVTLE